MKKFLKYFFGVIVGILAIIGLLFVGITCYLFTSESFLINISDDGISITENRIMAAQSENLELLKQSSFKPDTVRYHFSVVQDSARAQEIRDYFKLDTLYSPDATTWEKAVAISKFVATIPHDNPQNHPKDPNAIDLWKYSRDVPTGFNCRMHAILNYELMQAAGLTARYVTCFPQDSTDQDCHVVNEVWLPEQGKWVFLDADMGGHYCTDQNGTPLNLLEMREKYAAREKMVMYPGFEDGTTKHNYYYAYMAKNTYWFSCWEKLHFFQEDRSEAKDQDFGSSRYVLVVPDGFTPFGYEEREHCVTTDASRFWAPPQ
jgi:hypothetical protein